MAGRRILAVLGTIVLGPGAGHLLVGAWRRAVLWFLTYPVMLALAPFTVWAVAAWFTFARLAAAVDVAVLRLDGEKLPDFGIAAQALAGWLVLVVGLGMAFRTWVLEGFKIPAGSMMPTVLIGDHIFVKKYDRDPQRGDIAVFTHPCETDKDFIKRVVALGGDRVEIRCSTLYVNGEPAKRELVEGECKLDDRDLDGRWFQEACSRYHETLDGKTYDVVEPPDLARLVAEAHDSTTAGLLIMSDFPSDRPVGCGLSEPAPGEFRPSSNGQADGCALSLEYVIPEGYVFVLGDNRANSSDSRHWGPVPVENIKGTAAYVWWSEGDGVRWDRFGAELK